jgi:c-di-AMP phosphodiesterase-like protein
MTNTSTTTGTARLNERYQMLKMLRTMSRSELIDVALSAGITRVGASLPNNELCVLIMNRWLPVC